MTQEEKRLARNEASRRCRQKKREMAKHAMKPANEAKPAKNKKKTRSNDKERPVETMRAEDYLNSISVDNPVELDEILNSGDTEAETEEIAVDPALVDKIRDGDMTEDAVLRAAGIRRDDDDDLDENDNNDECDEDDAEYDEEEKDEDEMTEEELEEKKWREEDALDADYARGRWESFSEMGAQGWGEEY